MPAQILVVDDDPAIVELLRRMLTREGYAVVAAADGQQALEQVAAHRPDLVLLDVTMPLMDGFTVCRRLKDNEETALIPVTMLTGLDDQDHRRRGIEAGADDFLTKPIDHVTLRARIRTQLRLKRLIDQLERTENVIFMLAQAVEAKDPYTEGHLQRISSYAEQMAHACGLSQGEVTQVRYGGILHDIGKIGVNDTILLKPGSLTSDEYEQIKQHPSIGAGIIGQMRFAPEVAPIIRGHHEYWNGRGYPDGLAGEAIPLGARIIAIVDSFDAMTTNRPYRQAMEIQPALAELVSAAGTQFDPALLAVFLDLVRSGRLHRPS
jgi:putative two-component system response regulator